MIIIPTYHIFKKFTQNYEIKNIYYIILNIEMYELLICHVIDRKITNVCSVK